MRDPTFKCNHTEKGIPFDRIKLPDLRSNKLTKQENERQKLLEGLSYILSTFSGHLLSLDLKLKDGLLQERETTKESRRHGHKDSIKTKSIGPMLIAPKPLVDMLNDLIDYNLSMSIYTLDAYLKVDSRQYRKNQPHSSNSDKKTIIRSIFSIPLLTKKNMSEELSAFKEPIPSLLQELLQCIWSGENPEPIRDILEKDHNVIIKKSQMDHLLIQQALEFPIPGSVMESDRDSEPTNNKRIFNE